MTELTKEQEKILDDVKKVWCSYLHNNLGKEIDKEVFEEGVEVLYKKRCLGKPIFLYYDSPKALRKAGLSGMGWAELLTNEKLGEISSSNQLIREINSSIFDFTFENDSFEFIGWAGLPDLEFPEAYRSENYYISYYMQAMKFDFFNRIGTYNFNNFDKYKNLLIKSRFFFVCFYIGHTISIQPPLEVHMMKRPRVLHSVKGPSLKFKDGDEYYYIRGVQIDKGIFKKVQDKSITLEEILEIKNEEEKSAILLMYQELYGEEGMYQFISKRLKEIDSYTHKTGDKTLCYTLFKGRLGRRNSVIYIRCYCPSTDRMFFLGVDSRNTNAKDAVASLYRIPRKLKDHIKYINRQGERFTTVLTDEGNKIRESITEYQLSDLVSISGDDYFRLMRYEF